MNFYPKTRITEKNPMFLYVKQFPIHVLQNTEYKHPVCPVDIWADP